MIASRLDRLFIIAGLAFAGAGLLLGEHMGRTGDHGQMPTHAHLMLAGWVFAALYGLIYRAWPALMTGALPVIHFFLHVLGALALTTAIYFIYGGRGEEGFVVPLAAGGGLAIIGGWLLFSFIFLTRSAKRA